MQHSKDKSRNRRRKLPIFRKKNKKKMDEESIPSISQISRRDSEESLNSKLLETEDKATGTKLSRRQRNSGKSRKYLDMIIKRKGKKKPTQERSQESMTSNFHDRVGNYQPDLSQIKETKSNTTSKFKSGEMDEENIENDLKRNKPETDDMDEIEETFSKKELKRSKENSDKKGKKDSKVDSDQAVVDDKSNMTDKEVDIESEIEAAEMERKNKKVPKKRVIFKKKKKIVQATQSVPPKRNKKKINTKKNPKKEKRSKTAKKSEKSRTYKDMGIPKASFKNVLKDIIREENPELRITDQAFHLLKTVSENFLVNMFSKMNNITLVSRRKTLMVRDAQTLFRNMELDELVMDHIGN